MKKGPQEKQKGGWRKDRWAGAGVRWGHGPRAQGVRREYIRQMGGLPEPSRSHPGPCPVTFHPA